MSIYEEVKKGLEEAIDYENGICANAKVSIRSKVVQPVEEFSKAEIKLIRLKANMTQKIFAEAMGVSTKTVEAWEGGRSCPDGAARRLLTLVAQNPFFLQEHGFVTYADEALG